MTQAIMNILLSAFGAVMTGLASFAVAKLTQWINSKISDSKAANFLNTVTTIVFNCVQEVSQTYVESLKASGSFNEAAQKEAYERCLVKVKSQLAPDLIDYITNNFGDLDTYLKSLIESAIYSLKK